MAVSYVGVASGNPGSATATSFVTTFPVGWAAGDIGLLVGHVSGGSLTMSTPAGWTLLPGVTWPYADGSASRVYAWHRVLQSGDTAPTITNSGSVTGGWELLVVRGADSIAQAAAANATGTTVTLPTLTGVTAGAALLVDAHSRVGSGTIPTNINLDGSYTEVVDHSTSRATTNANVRAAAGYVLVGSTGSYGGETVTSDVSSSMIGLLVEVAPTATTTPVSGTVGTAWSVSAPVTGGASTTWSVASPLSGAAATAWSVTSTASGSTAAGWSVASTASGAVATDWAVDAAAGGAVNTSWDVAAQVSGSTATGWATASPTGGSVSTAWSALAAAAGSVSTGWDTSATASGNAGTSWSVRSTATGSSATVWDVAALTSGVITTGWSVTAPAGGSLTAVWSTAATVDGATSTGWSVADVALPPPARGEVRIPAGSTVSTPQRSEVTLL
ncbi:hypothetical protein [Micromonospora carbonacea]|uniref:hypothetical protein n=1 Tax=Micromonospora carbonacea TaxID=47853 RepID=UPI00371C4A7B